MAIRCEGSPKEAVMQILSSAFGDGETIPARHTCDGADVSPPLTIADIPAGAVTLALVMDDPDAGAGTWDHWLAYDIPVVTAIEEGATELGTPGLSSWGDTGYRGPCCPRGQTHRYVTRVFALDTRLGLGPAAAKSDVLRTMSGHVLAEAVLTGRYGR
jgi:Raf kinase inhibitor-like YbhB/YbcL family protein